MSVVESCFKSLEEVCSELDLIESYIDPNESNLEANNPDKFIIYDVDGDVLYRWIKSQKRFFKNSPAFKEKRPKRNISELSPFTKEEQFQWSTIFGLSPSLL